MKRPLTAFLVFLFFGLARVHAISSWVSATATNSPSQSPSFNVTVAHTDGGTGAYGVLVYDTPVSLSSVYSAPAGHIDMIYIPWTHGGKTVSWSDPRGFTFNGTKTYTFVVQALSGPYPGWWFYSGAANTTCNGPTGTISVAALNGSQGQGRFQVWLNNNGYGSGVQRVRLLGPGVDWDLYSGSPIAGSWTAQWSDPQIPAPNGTFAYRVVASGYVSGTTYQMSAGTNATTTPFTITSINGPTVSLPSTPTFRIDVPWLGTTVEDDDGNTQTNAINHISIYDITHGGSWSQYVYSTGPASWTWTDPRGGALTLGTHTYEVRVNWTDYEAYNEEGDWVDGHYRDVYDWVDGEYVVVDQEWVDGDYERNIGIRQRNTSLLHAVTFTVTAGAPQSISFPALSSRTFGDAPFTVSATSSSGLPVSFAVVSGPATVSGNTVTLTGAGTVTIRATQNGGSSGGTQYGSASPVDQSFFVAKASQAIVFPPVGARTFGDPAFALSATASSGLPVTYSVVSGPATISGNQLTMTGGGTVTVSAVQGGNVNYNAATGVSQSFTVHPRAQSLSFPVISTRVYGDPAFAISASASSGLPVTFAIASGPATISGSVITLTGTGSVTVTASQAGNANYAPTSVNQTFTAGARLSALAVGSGGQPPQFQITVNNGGRGRVYSGASYYGIGYIKIVDTTDGTEFPHFYPLNGNWIQDSHTATWTDPRGLPFHGSHTYSFTAWGIDAGGWYSYGPVTAVATVNPGPAGTVSVTPTNGGVGRAQFSIALNNAGYGQGITNLRIEDVSTGYSWNVAPPGAPVLGTANFSWVNPHVPVFNGTHTYRFTATGTSGGYPYQLPVVSAPATSTILQLTPLPAATIYAGTVPKIRVMVPPINDEVTDDNGDSATNHVTYVDIWDQNTGHSYSIYDHYGAPSLDFTWTDPRGAMAASTHTYRVRVYTTNYEAYNDPVEDSDERDIGIRENGGTIDERTVTITIVNGAPQTITFPAIATRTYGDTSFALSATASSGLPVSYAVLSGPATVAGNTVTITGAGAVSIQATQAGGMNGSTMYVAATPVTQSFNVAKASQAISFGALPTRSFGAAAFSISASATSGLPVAFSVAAGPATISGSTVTLTGHGVVTIAASQGGNTNFNPAAGVSQSFTVTPPAPAITSAGNVTGTTGAPFSYTVTASQSPTSFGLSGTLPAGLTFNAVSGAISGTPTQVGTSNVTISATNAGGTGSAALTLAISAPVAPSITLQPQPQTVGAGGSATFTVGVGGSAPFTYQWRKDGVAISGATAVSYTLGTAQPADIGSYSVVVMNQVGSTTSMGAALTVNNAPVIVTGPQSQTIAAGSPATFTVTASGAAPLTYQWRHNGINLPGADAAACTVPAVRDTNAGAYTVVVTNSVGSTTSAAASLTVTGTSYPQFLTVVNGTAVAGGGSSGQVVSITANPPPSGQYFAGWSKVSGLGFVQDVAQPTTNFILGNSDAVVRSNYTTVPPVLGITWDEVNLPSTITVGDTSTAGSVVRFTAVATNSGSAPWGGSIAFHVRDSSGQVRTWSQPHYFKPGGVLPGGKSPHCFTFGAPTAPGFYTYTISMANGLFTNNNFGSTITRNLTVVAAGAGTRPGVAADGSTVYNRVATVGSACSFDVSVPGATSYGVVGTFPPGVSLNASSGLISGTPEVAGDYAVTITATNFAGTTTYALMLTVYAPGANRVTVVNGFGGTSNLPVGADGTIAARPVGSGEIFNGWAVLSGPGVVADPSSSLTTIRLSQPGDTTVRANFIAGYPLTVREGSASPLGGVAGAAIALTAKPDANGMMFSSWVVSGPGSIVNAGAQNTVFTMGAGPATVTANYVAGYRLNVGPRATAAGPGGTPGTRIAVSTESPSSSEVFCGWEISGPGFLEDANAQNTAVVMGRGAATVRPYYWPSNQSQPLKTYVSPNATNVAPGQSFNVVTTTINTHGNVTLQQLDYSLDNGATWIAGTAGAGTRWEGSRPPSFPVAWQMTSTMTFHQPVTVIFRAAGLESGYGASLYAYAKVVVGGGTPLTILAHPASQTARAGDRVTLSVVAHSEGGINYQWRRNGQALAGATASSKIIEAISPADAGTYDVQVASTNAVLTSSPASVQMVAGPSVLNAIVSVLHPTGLGLFSTSTETGTVGDILAVSSNWAGSTTAGWKHNIRIWRPGWQDAGTHGLTGERLGNAMTAAWNVAAAGTPDASAPGDASVGWGNPYVGYETTAATADYPAPDLGNREPFVHTMTADESGARTVRLVLDAPGTWYVESQVIDSSGASQARSTRQKIEVTTPILEGADPNLTYPRGDSTHLVGAYMNLQKHRPYTSWGAMYGQTQDWATNWRLMWQPSPYAKDNGGNFVNRKRAPWNSFWSAHEVRPIIPGGTGRGGELTADLQARASMRKQALRLMDIGVDFVIIDYTNVLSHPADEILPAMRNMRDGFADAAGTRPKRVQMCVMLPFWGPSDWNTTSPSDTQLANANAKLATFYQEFARDSNIWPYVDGKPLLLLFVGTGAPGTELSDIYASSTAKLRVTVNGIPKSLRDVFTLRYSTAYGTGRQNLYHENGTYDGKDSAGGTIIGRKLKPGHWTYVEGNAPPATVTANGDAIEAVTVIPNIEGTAPLSAAEAEKAPASHLLNPLGKDRMARLPERIENPVSADDLDMYGKIWEKALDNALALKPKVLLFMWSEFGSENDEPNTAQSWTVMDNNKYGTYYGDRMRRAVAKFKEEQPSDVRVETTSRTVASGGTITLTAWSRGEEATGYQWFKNGVALSGQTGGKLTITNAQPGDSAEYAVRVTNARGSGTSPGTSISVTGTVTAPSSATISINNSTVVVGATVTFTANSNGTAPITYRWLRNDAVVAEGTSNTYNITNAQSSHAGAYKVQALNSAGAAISLEVMLTVNVTPTVRIDPGNVTAQAGSDVVFTAVTTLTGRLNYEWLMDDIPVENATDATYVVAAATPVRTGLYTVKVWPAGATRQENKASAIVSPAVTLTVQQNASLANVSVRTTVSGSDPLIVGLVTKGTVNKPLLVRGVGPSLARFGVAGTMADPQLKLYSATGEITSNNDWDHTSQSLIAKMTSVGAFSLGTTNGVWASTTDAVIDRNVPAGAYTVHALPNTGASGGVVLVEAYDADLNQPSRIVNLSARSFAGTDSNSLIAGFVVNGNGLMKVLVRAVGPRLSKFQVSGVLADPVLTVKNGSGQVIATNDDWPADLATVFQAAQAFALTDESQTADDRKSAALVAWLPPGNYTAIVTGANGTTGNALVEVYQLE